LALVVLSVVEQRLDAVRAVLDGAEVTEVAARMEVHRATVHGARPAGPPPQPSADPVRVQRRVSATGVIMVAGQKIALGRVHAGQTVTVLVSGTSLTIQLGDAEPRVIPRTTAQPVRSIKGQRPRAAASDSAAAATVLP
jgi:hypothetical protein